MLLLYAYCVGIVSPQKIERACHEDLVFRVLMGNQQPDHSRISEFRSLNLDGLKDLYRCAEACGYVQILRRFLLRGLEKVTGEWHLIAATHNLLKLFRHLRTQQVLAAAKG